jgi:5-oxoprolinase (ATP-hydrolysing)
MSWEFFIDRGGTFTDCIGKNPATGELVITKVLSSDHAPLVAIRKLLGLSENDPIPPCNVRMGTTLATNALLEKKGRPTALIVTRGFADLLLIGTQARPELFALRIQRPKPLPARVLETEARLTASGEVLEKPDLERLRRELPRLRQAGIESVAISVLHAYRDGALEAELAAVVREAGFEWVSESHAVAREIGYLDRTATTVLDAYLTPLLRDYTTTIAHELGSGSLSLMQSSGGLTNALGFRGPNAILSGPAGGVVAVGHLAKRAGVERAIGFDMGGTSTDVCRLEVRDGEIELPRVYASEVAGIPIRAPMMDIHTVASGGGSICRAEDGRLSVGPDSAGADPGPLCYGNPRARELTLTDVNLALGRVVADRFPIPLDGRSGLQKLAELGGTMSPPLAAEQLAEGFFDIAVHHMAEAIRKVSVGRGEDVRSHTLIVFGGAGGQHACALARRLGIERVLFHPLAGVQSALGMGLADDAWHGERDVARAALEAPELETVFSELVARGRHELALSGHEPDSLRVSRRLDVRYAGAESVLTLDLDRPEPVRTRFDREHGARFGHQRPNHPVEVVCVRVEVTASHAPLVFGSDPTSTERTANGKARLFANGSWHEDVPVIPRENLVIGSRQPGPLVVLDPASTVVIDPGFELEVGPADFLTARPATGPDLERAPNPEGVDPVWLEIMGNQFMSIAEQMGEALRRTAFSTNIRERLDFSCALFDEAGNLVANAPHIPVHLGAMGESVRAVREAHPTPAPGDVFVTNDPARGGSHLPDVTVVTPIHDASGVVSFFTACRGHHADVGGTTPGSMPAFSSRLDEEGVVLRALRIVSAGNFDRDGIWQVLTRGPHPARQPETNLLDLEAQIAANQTGARLLGELDARYGATHVRHYMRAVEDEAARRVALEIQRLPDGDHAFADRLDDGTPIAVTLRVRGDRLRVDFTGTGAESPRNLNAPRAVTIAAVIYFLRVLVGRPIPLNSGCLRNVEIVIPTPSILSPSAERAVAGGNVETSQRVVDVLLAAVGLSAASQGTMNNLSFGADDFAYYETIAGGAGAGRDFDGASAVHTHMTNTKITDPEILESRFPVRLRHFRIRHGSGGAGRQRGGDGVVREIEALRPLELSILSERRQSAPFGLAGGEPGKPGKNLWNGREIPAATSIQLAAGDRVTLETPGGGGYGPPPQNEGRSGSDRS